VVVVMVVVAAAIFVLPVNRNKREISGGYLSSLYYVENICYLFCE
jgi:hypothetical protein